MYYFVDQLKNEIRENVYLENIYLDIALRLSASFRLVALALHACEITLTNQKVPSVTS